MKKIFCFPSETCDNLFISTFKKLFSTDDNLLLWCNIVDLTAKKMVNVMETFVFCLHCFIFTKLLCFILKHRFNCWIQGCWNIIFKGHYEFTTYCKGIIDILSVFFNFHMHYLHGLLIDLELLVVPDLLLSFEHRGHSNDEMLL